MTTSAAEWQRHASTYHGFTLAVKWFCIHLATLMTLLIVWFATSAGFVGAVVLAAIVYAASIWAMNRFLAHSTENDNGELAAAVEAEHRSEG